MAKTLFQVASLDMGFFNTNIYWNEMWLKNVETLLTSTNTNIHGQS